MAPLESVSNETLQETLEAVESKAATQRLMVAVGAKQGLSASELAEWYGYELDTVEEWLDAFEQEGVEAVVEDVERFALPGRASKPVVRQPGVCRVTFLNYDVISDMGWDIDDEDLFVKAAESDLEHEDYGRVVVRRGESILEAAEDRGYDWPYACRGGACSNCAVVLHDGEIAMPGNQILPESAIERGARLTCVGVPATKEVEIIYNAKHLDFLDELRLPPGPFERSHSV